jgi:hypothetical protein
MCFWIKKQKKHRIRLVNTLPAYPLDLLLSTLNLYKAAVAALACGFGGKRSGGAGATAE